MSLGSVPTALSFKAVQTSARCDTVRQSYVSYCMSHVLEDHDWNTQVILTESLLNSRLLFCFLKFDSL